ncbi:MAG: hypothetical protein MN733_27790 [Nitrososphaera sp.]|nr:hypothetical protein [Nitrososphaera sp.]
MTRAVFYPFIIGMPPRTGTGELSPQFAIGPAVNGLIRLRETVGIDPVISGHLTALINFVVQTSKVDLGNHLYKFVPRIEMIGDIRPGIELDVQWSDDDHGTFSTFRTVNMGSNRPRLSQNGRSRRRIFRVGNLDTVLSRAITKVRLEALEVFVYGGHAG